jgi:hypothetical protein
MEELETLVLDLNLGTQRHILRGRGIRKLSPSEVKKNELPNLRNSEQNSFIAIEVNGISELTHPEHRSLKLDPGVWLVTVIREYDPFERAIRPVFD